MHFRQVNRQELAPHYRAAWNAEYPEDLRSEDEILGGYVIVVPGAVEEHWVADGHAAIVSAFDINGKHPVDNLTIDFAIDPAAEHLVPAALDVADDIAARVKPKSIGVWSSDLRRDRMKLFEQRGLKLVQTVPMTRLDILTFDANRFADKSKAVEDAGIRLTTIAELENEGIDWAPLLHESAWEMAEDMPRVHAVVQPTLEQYREMVKNTTVYKRDLMFAAMSGDRLVAYSRVTPAETMPHLVRTGLSGTVRDHRRRGLITALKVKQIQTLRERGYTLLQTDNDHRNPMYNLNLALGFTDRWNYVQYEKKL